MANIDKKFANKEKQVGSPEHPISPPQDAEEFADQFQQRRLALQKKRNRRVGLMLFAVVALFFLSAMIKRWIVAS